MAQLNRITKLLFRYSAVCRPHAYRDSNITERTGTRVAKYVTPVIIFSAIYNIPKFLEYKVSGTVRKCSTDHSDKNPSTSPGCFETKHRAILFSGHWSMLCLSFMGKPLMSSQSVNQDREDNQIKSMMFPPHNSRYDHQDCPP